jgi:hypothetical protein
MSLKVSYKGGVFEPLENVESVRPGTIYTVFSDDELRDIRETFGRRNTWTPPFIGFARRATRRITP